MTVFYPQNVTEVSLDEVMKKQIHKVTFSLLVYHFQNMINLNTFFCNVDLCFLFSFNVAGGECLSQGG